METIDQRHPTYTKLLPIWTLVRDCLEGEAQVKSKKTTYLPKPNPEDTSDANEARYKNYLARAIFYAVTGRTLNGLVGQVFSKDSTVELPTLLQALEPDADGSGVSLLQSAELTLREALGPGRCGILVDYPSAEEGDVATREQVASGEKRPVLLHYTPESIINWHVKARGAQRVVDRIVLEEQTLEPKEDDPYVLQPVMQWRVLVLEDDVYHMRVYRRSAADGGHSGNFELVSETRPVDSAGMPFSEIPFVFVGWKNNDPEPDTAPLADLAGLNIGHYRNSADYEDSCFLVGQPTPFFSGLSQNWIDEVLHGQVRLGSRAAVLLPEGGTGGLLQAAPNTLVFEAMEHKERQMVALGAKLVEQRSVQRTLGEAAMEEASEVSVLSNAANNVSDAYVQALVFAGMFAGESAEPEFELNTDFEMHKLTAQERQVLIAEWQGGGIDFEEYRFNLKRAGVAFKEDEEVRDAVEAELGREEQRMQQQQGNEEEEEEEEEEDTE